MLNRCLTTDAMTLAVFLLGAISLSVPSGYSYATVILVLASIFYLIKHRIGPLPSETKILGFFMLLYASYWIIESLWRGAGMRAMDEPSRFVFAFICLLALSSGASIRNEGLWFGVAIGAISAAFLGYWQVFIEQIPRATGFVGADHFGSLGMILGLLSAIGFIRAIAIKKHWSMVTLCAAGAVAGPYAALLSGTRASWGAAVIVVMLLIYLLTRYFTNGRGVFLAGLGVTLILLIAGILDFTNTGRIAEFVYEVKDYFGSGHQEGSIAIRFDIWRVAFSLFLERPVLGWGDIGYAQQMTSAGEQGMISPFAASLGSSHAHNQFLDALVKKGLIGAVVLMMVYLFPMLLFLRRLGHSIEPEVVFVSVAGLTIVIMTLAYGIAHSPLGSHSGVVTYAFWVAIFGGLAFRAQAPQQQ